MRALASVYELILSKSVLSWPTSTPSNVLFVVIAPVIAPPDFGSAALAVVVVLVNIPSLVAISTPSTVPVTVTLPVTVTPLVSVSIFLALS